MISIAERAASYLERMPPAIALSGGHTATYNAAAALVRGFAMSEADALPLLVAWNSTHCMPPWSEGELRHKLRDAAKSTRPLGYLLKDDAAPVRDRLAPDFENESEKKARQRKSWPAFRELSADEIRTVANLRGILPDAVDLLNRAGILRAAIVDGHACFIMRGVDFAQARRMNGELFTRHEGEQIKAKNLLGSEGAFIGHSLLFPSVRRVLLLEGCIGLAEGIAALLMVNTREPWSVLAATGASSRFARDPALLARLAGCHVRIVPDTDEAGMNAAASWLADLEAAGAHVDALPLPAGCKDLGDIIAAPESHLETITAIFQ